MVMYMKRIRDSSCHLMLLACLKKNILHDYYTMQDSSLEGMRGNVEGKVCRQLRACGFSGQETLGAIWELYCAGLAGSRNFSSPFSFSLSLIML